MVGFIFGGDTGLSAEDLNRQRAVAEALLARAKGAPRNVGEGLAAIGNALAYRMVMNKADKGESARRQASQGIFDDLIGGGSSTTMPTPGAGGEIAATAPGTGQPIDMTGNEVYDQFMGTVKEGVTNPYALAAIAATGKAESGFSPENVNRTWSDPSESGQAGTAGGIMSWRGPRYQALAATGDLSPAGQARFFLGEDPALIERLNGAKSVEEAQSLMNNAWKFAGYDLPGGEAANRLSYANSFLPTFQGQGGAEVASLDPAAGMAEGAIVPGAEPIVPMGGQGMPDTAVDGGQNPAVAAIDAQTTALPVPGQAEQADGIMQAVNGTSTGGTFGLNPMQQEVAQAVINRGGPTLEKLLRAAADPRLTDEHRAVVNAMLEREMAKEQASADEQRWRSRQDYERQAQEGDPLRKLQLRKAQAEVDALGQGELKVVGKRLVRAMPDGSIVDVTPGGEAASADFDDVSSVRKEIHQLPSYKNMAQALPIYRSMAETAGRSTKASDLNLVYGLGKIMDPTSVVREGEMVMVKNTASLPDWLQGAIASLNGGAALTPETRQAIMNEAYGRVQGYDQAFQQDASMYTGIAERNRMNLADILPDFGKYQPWSIDGTAAGDQVPEGVDPKVWGIMTPEERALWK